MCECAEPLQSCLTLCDTMDCSHRGSFVHEIFQARILEWVAMPSFRGSSQPRDRTLISYIPCISRRVLYHQCQLGSPRQHQQQINRQPDLRTRLLMSLLLRAAWLIKEPISSEQPGRQYSINFSYHIYFICTAIIILLSH